MNFVTTLLTLTHQLHVYHWQTDSFSAHEALGEAYSELDGLMDQFVEVFMGKNGKISSKGGFSLKLSNITEVDPIRFIDTAIDYLTNSLPKEVKEQDTDLLNIRDEMLAVLNKLKYKLVNLK
jgi:DNA-binding ferritin-like protein